MARQWIIAKFGSKQRLDLSDKYQIVQDDDSDGASNPDTDALLEAGSAKRPRFQRKPTHWVWKALKAVGLLILLVMSAGFVVCVSQHPPHIVKHNSHEHNSGQSISFIGSHGDPYYSSSTSSSHDHANHNANMPTKAIHDLSPMESPCGDNPVTARAAGCVFDIISFSWLPERCHDAELAAEFADMKTWEWYKDLDRREQVPHDEALTGEYPVLYVDWGYHIQHCTYMWRKMHRALEGPYGIAGIDGYIGSLAHTEHCGHMLLSNRDAPLDKMNTGIRVKYPSCGILT